MTHRDREKPGPREPRCPGWEPASLSGFRSEKGGANSKERFDLCFWLNQELGQAAGSLWFHLRIGANCFENSELFKKGTDKVPFAGSTVGLRPTAHTADSRGRSPSTHDAQNGPRFDRHLKRNQQDTNHTSPIFEGTLVRLL